MKKYLALLFCLFSLPALAVPAKVVGFRLQGQPTLPRVDVRMVSFDTESPVYYLTDFGSYVPHVDFTLANDSDIPASVVGTFAIRPVDVEGSTLSSSASYQILSPHEVTYWNLFDSMPVYYGPGNYEFNFCLALIGAEDPNPSNNCLAQVFNLVPYGS